MTQIQDPKVGVVFLGRRRIGFDPDWGQQIEQRVRRSLDTTPIDTFLPTTHVTDDRSLRSAVAECRDARCTVLATLQTTMSDGRLAPVMSQLWPDPVILWATPENPEGTMISSCSLLGIHTFASTLRQLGRPFEIVNGDPEEPNLQSSLADAIHAAHAVHRVRASNVGLIGYHAPGFIDMHADPFDLNRSLNVQLRHLGLQELIDAMKALPPQQVAEDLARVMAMGLPLEGVTEQDLETQSRYYLALRALADDACLDAWALRCWAELPNVVGQWPYLAMVRLTEAAVPNAMEGDVDGAITCLLGEALGMGRGYLSDWLEHTRDTVTLWHPGNAPRDLCEPAGSPHGPKITQHFNVPKPAVVAARLKADLPITAFRLWRCDHEYRLTALEGVTETPPRELQGTHGTARFTGANIPDWFDRMCHQGLPHHVAVFAGHHATRLRMWARHMRVNWLE